MSDTVYSLGLWNDAKNGCLRICEAVGRFLGFIDNIAVTKSKASCGTVDLNHSFKGRCFTLTSFIIV